MNNHNNFERKAFTIAEVLITLGIVGVIAALVLPSVIDGYKNKIRVTKLEKAASVLSNAFIILSSSYGDVENWTSADLSTFSGSAGPQSQLLSDDIGMKFAEVISNNIVCTPRDNTVMKKCLVNSDASSMKFLDGSGMSGLPFFAMSTPDFKIAFGPFVDLNAINNPKIKKKIYMQIFVFTDIQSSGNAFGRNIFTFLLTDKGIIPAGAGNYSDFNSNNMYPFDVYCFDSGKIKRGFGCTAWVLEHKNFEYLKGCKNISYNGEHICK